MFERLKSLFARPSLDAASQLAPVAPIKGKPGARSWPAFFSSKKPSDAVIQRPERRLVNTDVLTYRNGTSTHKVLQDMVAASPELSNAVYTAIRLGVPERYVAVARDMDGTLNPEATKLLQTILTRFDVIGDPLEGYTGTGSIKSISESLARDLVMYGQLAGELVLDKGRMPYRIQPISSTVIEFMPDNGGVRPIQKVGSDEIDLDVPTVAIVQLDATLLTPYSSSPIEPAVRAVIFSETFFQDLLKIMKRVIHPRQKVVIDEEKFRKFLSPEAQADEEKARQEMNALLSQIESKVNSLSPEDALVYFDSLEFVVEVPDGSEADYSTVRDIANAKLASGSKTLPSVLGLESGSSSSNIASTEVALYIRSIDSAIRQKLNEFYSRILTIAIRLMGVDGYVTFTYEPINLRPESELESFYQTRQQRTLEQLSYGFISDEEASLTLTGKLPPPTFKPLSGTMFLNPAPAADANLPVDQAAHPSNDGSTVNQKTKSDQPAQGRGGNKKVQQPANQ